MEKIPTKIPIYEDYLRVFSRIKDKFLEDLLRDISRGLYLKRLTKILKEQDWNMEVRNLRGNCIGSGIVLRRINIDGKNHYNISRLCELCIQLTGAEEANTSLNAHFRKCIKYYPELKKYFFIRKRKQERLYATPENFAKFLADFFVIYDVYRQLKWPEKN